MHYLGETVLVAGAFCDARSLVNFIAACVAQDSTYRTYRLSYAGRTARHFGKPLHPQNWFPCFSPLFAVRNTIGLPHLGQAFSVCCCFCSTIVLTCLTCSTCVLIEGFRRPDSRARQILAISLSVKIGSCLLLIKRI